MDAPYASRSDDRRNPNRAQNDAALNAQQARAAFLFVQTPLTEQITPYSSEPESPMNIPDIFGQIRPLLSLAGSIAIGVGLVDFAGFGNIPGNGLETAVAGWLAKNL